jgi:hypothetical protein
VIEVGKILQEKKIKSTGKLAISGLLTRIEKFIDSKDWNDQWVNWDDLGDDDPGWGDVCEGPDKPGPDDR